MATETVEEERARREREVREREAELAKIPLREIDKSKWPRNVRPIALGEASGLGIDATGRLYWDGKPVEIIGQRLDLTWTQNAIAIFVAVFTAVGAIGAVAQGLAVYEDWACKVGWRTIATCPTARAPVISE